MTENKLTDNEIKKALEICLKGNCKDCMYEPDGNCRKRQITESVNLINRLQAEVEDKDILLNHQGEVIKTLEQACKEQMAENERLKKESEIFADIGKMYSEIKAEAYKEFFQLIHKEFVDISNGYFESKNIDACVVMQGAIDKLRETYKEMVGEDNA